MSPGKRKRGAEVASNGLDAHSDPTFGSESTVGTRHSLRRRGAITVRQIIFVVLFSLLLASLDSYLNSERNVSDLLIPFSCLDKDENRVVIVQIDEQDFAEEFHATSPLDPDAVSAAIDAIALGTPRAIGVDLLTSEEYGRRYKPREYVFPLIWASTVKKLDDQVLIAYQPPLGGQALPTRNFAALPETREDEGVHRSYERLVEIVGVEYPSFPWAVYALAFPANNKNPEAGSLYIRFCGPDQQDSRPTISVSQVLSAARQGKIDTLQHFFADRVVLLGGMYTAARDRKTVPLGGFRTGDIFGVQLMATIIETEMRGEPNKPLPPWLKFVVNLLAILMFTVNFFHYGVSVRSIAIAIATATLTAIILSLYLQDNLSAVPFFITALLMAALVAVFEVVTDKYKAILRSMIEGVVKSVKTRFSKR